MLPDPVDSLLPRRPPPPTLWERLQLTLGLRTTPAPRPRTLDPGALGLLLQQHALSLESREEGEPLDLRGTGAIGLTFPECSLAGACLYDAVLQRADLTRVHDLLPESLAGADLSSCRLPPSVDFAPTLRFLRELSRNAGKLYLGLLLSAAVIVLTTISVSDASLLSNLGVATLPVARVAVPVRLFFSVAPTVLFLQFLTLHFYLQRLWGALATLPAIFPDGAPLEHRIHPWLMSDLVRAGFPILAARRTPIDGLQETSFRLLAFWATPLAIGAVWLRTLPRHDWFLTVVQTLLFVLSLLAASAFLKVARATLRRDPPERERDPQRWQPVALRGGILTATLLYVAWGALVGAPSLGESDQAYIARRRQLSRPGANTQEQIRAYRFNGHRWPLIGDLASAYEYNDGIWPPIYSWWQCTAPHLLELAQVQAVANLKEQKVSTPPEGWIDPGEEAYIGPTPDQETPAQRTAREALERTNERIRLRLKLVVGGALHGADLSWARAEKVFLVNADLREMRAPGVRMGNADLRRSSLNDAVLTFADLSFARLQGAQLIGAHLEAAHLSGARLQEADLGDAHLDDADLGDAKLQGAYLGRASLRGAQMVTANLENAYLGKCDLRAAYLFNASLKGAQLTGANLSGADLSETHLNRADFTRANLTGVDLRGADLTGALLGGADLDGALFQRGADRTTRWPGGRPPEGYEIVPLRGQSVAGLCQLRKRRS